MLFKAVASCPRSIRRYPSGWKSTLPSKGGTFVERLPAASNFRLDADFLALVDGKDTVSKLDRFCSIFFIFWYWMPLKPLSRWFLDSFFTWGHYFGVLMHNFWDSKGCKILGNSTLQTLWLLMQRNLTWPFTCIDFRKQPFSVSVYRAIGLEGQKCKKSGFLGFFLHLRADFEPLPVKKMTSCLYQTNLHYFN